MGVIDDLIGTMTPGQLWDLQEALEKAASLTPSDYQRKFDDLQQQTEDNFQNLANQLATGRLSPLAFKDRLFRTLRRAMSDAYRYGLGAAGERAILFDADLAVIRGYLTEDAAFLSGFYQDLKAGDVPGTPNEKPEPSGRFSVDQRVVMYSNALRGIFFKGYVARVNDPATTILWQLGETEHCGNCLDMDAGNPYTIASLAGRVPGADVCEGLDRCGCSLVYSNS